MLTPEQVREIRSLLYTECSKADYYDAMSRLIVDRAEIAAELERIRHNTATVWPWAVTLEAIIKLAERIKT